MLGVSLDTVKDLEKKKAIAVVRVGCRSRFRWDDIQEYIKRQTIPAQAAPYPLADNVTPLHLQTRRA
jgi:excisionase family DNA binding protein